MEAYNKQELNDILEYVKQLYESRGLKQTALAQDSGVSQPTICKLFSGALKPSAEVLRRLCKGLGTNMDEILQTPERASRPLLAYLATPLTNLSDEEDSHLRELVHDLRVIAADPDLGSPGIELYWPGDFTHPKKNPEHTDQQVYRKDRSWASCCNFLILVCLSPSYGVGQENEIAAQAGNPAIRLLPEKLSRMLTGSVLLAHDVPFVGSLSAGVKFDREAFKAGLKWAQQIYFTQLPLYGDLNGNEFGQRLSRLLENRVADRRQFTLKLGVADHYLEVLIKEPFTASNPSARLLRRMARLLGVKVGYLLGETRDADPIWIGSHSSWKAWVKNDSALRADIAFEVLQEWEAEYDRESRRSQATVSSARSNSKITLAPMTEREWDKRYQRRAKREAEPDDGGPKLF